MGFFGNPEKTNDFNVLSSFDYVDDFTSLVSPRFLNSDVRNSGLGNAQATISVSGRAGFWWLQTQSNTAGASALSGNISYRLDSWSQLSIAASFRVFTLPDGTDKYRIFLGFNSSYVATTAPTTNAVGLFLDEGNANWQAYTYSSSTGTITDTGVAAVADGSYNTFLTRANGSSSVDFVINNVVVATHSTNIPATTALSPFLSIAKTAGTNNRSLYVDWMRFSGQGNSRSLGVSA